MTEQEVSPPFSKAADKNKDVILDQLRNCLEDGARVLEIASGTGQHALHFSEQWPELYWQVSDADLDAYGLRKALEPVDRPNLPKPVNLNIQHWPNLRPKFDAVFSANCVHIAGMEVVQHYFEGAAKSLQSKGVVLLYGPFKFGGQFTTQSNADFDAFLKDQNPQSGIRDFEALDELASAAGFNFESRTDLPSNNHFLNWRKLQ